MEILLLLIRLFLFAVFAVAGVGKLLDLEGSKKSVIAFGTPEDLAKTFAVAIPFAEIVFAVCLLFVSTSWLGAIGVFLFLLIFIGGMISQLSQGKAPECHCFGAIHSEPVSRKSIVRNVIFAFLSLILVVQGRNQGAALADLSNEIALQLIFGLATVGILGAVVFYLKRISEQQTQIMRRIEILEITTHDGAPVEHEHNTNPYESLPIGSPAPDFALPDLSGNTVSLENLLAEKKPLLFFYVSPTCTPCEALLPEIEAWQAELKDKVRFVFLSLGAAQENREKFGDAHAVLLQKNKEVTDALNARWTPTAVLINAEGAIASHLAVGDAAIRELVEKIKAERAGCDLLYITNGNQTMLGESVPEFSLADLHGKQIGANDFRGKKTLVTFWSTTCPHCSNMMDELKNWEREKGADEPDLLVFSDGDAETHKALQLNSPIILDKNYKTAERLGMSGTPSAVLVDENGKIVSETAIGAGNIWALVGKRK
ncbi:MAG: TlpA disulfide reductase family protein [Pyrinomonadaceae bacterium]